VLIDEVESFAVRRSAASFGSNPVDVHRATDALLTGIDAVAADLPRVLFVATTNFVEAVDEAFLSRADLVVELALPDAATIAQILRHSLLELSVLWPGIGSLADDDGLHAKLATACAGWDGRRVRKLALSALALRQATTRDPNLLTADDLLAAAETMAPEDMGVG
jgi:AAA+ superfamily predicted ATPase